MGEMPARQSAPAQILAVRDVRALREAQIACAQRRGIPRRGGEGTAIRAVQWDLATYPTTARVNRHSSRLLYRERQAADFPKTRRPKTFRTSARRMGPFGT